MKIFELEYKIEEWIKVSIIIKSLNCHGNISSSSYSSSWSTDNCCSSAYYHFVKLTTKKNN